MTTRSEYIKWAKDRALAYLEINRVDDAILSLLSDFNKEKELVGRATLETAKELYPFARENPGQFIKGFN